MRHGRHAGPLVVWILVAAIVLGIWNVAHGHERKPTPEPDTQSVDCCIKKDREIPAAVLTAAVLTVAVAAVCAWKRLVLDDPCITREPHQTTPADDNVTPPDMNGTMQALR